MSRTVGRALARLGCTVGVAGLSPRRRRRLWIALAGLLAAGVLGAGGSSAAGINTDARWQTLEHCLTVGEANLSRAGEVDTPSTGRITVYAPDGFISGISYESTFARAEAQAKRTKEQIKHPRDMSVGAGLAIGNVTYYFTALASTPQIEMVTKCLVTTYPNGPKWPAGLQPGSLATSGKSPPGP